MKAINGSIGIKVDLYEPVGIVALQKQVFNSTQNYGVVNDRKQNKSFLFAVLK